MQNLEIGIPYVERMDLDRIDRPVELYRGPARECVKNCLFRKTPGRPTMAC